MIRYQMARIFAKWLLLMAISFLGSPVLQGQEHGNGSEEAADSAQAEEPKGTAAPPVVAPATGRESKLHIHGYLTQAYARSKFLSRPGAPPAVEDEVLGIPEDGTFDYRKLALQVSYQHKDTSRMVIQISHLRAGESIVNPFNDDLELDWAFFQGSYPNGLEIKVGRAPIPIGFDNEIRDVGVLLPFFSPSEFYGVGDKSYAVETIDGAIVSYTLFSSSRWPMRLNALGGGWQNYEITTGRSFLADFKGFGGSLALSTPLDGLRIQLGWIRGDGRGGFEGVTRPIGKESTRTDSTFSIGYEGGRVAVTFEHRFIRFSTASSESFLGQEADLDSLVAALQVSVALADGLRLNLRGQQAESRVFGEAQLEERATWLQRREIGLSVNYWLSSNAVLKIEYNRTEADAIFFGFTARPDGTPAFTFQPSPYEPGYNTILSLAVSF